MAVNFLGAYYNLTLVLLALGVYGDESLTTTTSESPLDVTDIPDTAVQYAIVEHWGPYTTMDFYYMNEQYKDFKESDRCYDQHIKCLISQVVVTPVCAYDTNPKKPLNKNSYCDVYYENCLLKYLRYKILSYGVCNSYQHIVPT